ncbi:MAG: hypothetical protein ALAOOOJD_00197 [bacterium]|nr:hypothetical protein [bacterium]
MDPDSQGFGLSTFAQRQRDYLQNYEQARMDEDQKIWAWFEAGRGYNGDGSKNSSIDLYIKNWLDGTPGQTDTGWTSSHGVLRLHLLRVLKKYLNAVKPAEAERIKTRFHDLVYSDFGSDIWNCGTSNGVFSRKVVAYIYLEDHREATVKWPVMENYRICQGNFNGANSFSYGGRTYEHGKLYNGYEIVRDWIYATFERWVEGGDWCGEFDAFYTAHIVYALYTLHDFAQDVTMKRKARMMLDLLLLETILNVSSNSKGEAMHGGVPGRTYGDQMLRKSDPWIFWYPLWGLTRSGYQYAWHTFANIYLSDYAEIFSQEGLLADIGCLVNESPDYCHMLTKYHSGGGNRGKFVYVTKNYSIGSVVTGLNHWIINVLSGSDKSRSGMRIWIDHYPQIPGPGDGEYYLEYGESGYQYQNAILVFADWGPNYLHFADADRNDEAGNSFDGDEQDGHWRFLRKDEAGATVAMAVQMGRYTQAIEMCQVGIDYPSYADFKNAVKSRANLQDHESGKFTTSKGQQIGRVYDPATQIYHMVVDGRRTYPDGVPDNGQRAKRLECMDRRGNQIVEWNDSLMMVTKNGRTVTYNFADWTVAGQAVTPRVGAPFITPDGGTFTTPVTVTMSTRTEGATIYYTTDGSTPTPQSTPYTAPLLVSKNTAINAKAFKADLPESYLSFANFLISADRSETPPPESVAMPTIDPAGGAFVEPVWVTLRTETADAEIYFTTDGGEPTPQSNVYTEPFIVNESALVKAKACKSGMADSAVAMAAITIGALEITPPATEVIIDDDDSAQVIFEGSEWEEVKHLHNSFGGGARWHYNNQGSAVTWRPHLNQPGEYEVLVWWGDGYDGLGTKVPYLITHANGITTVYKDQNVEPGQWHSLGKYIFHAGTTGSVTMSDKCGSRIKFVVADAIKFATAPKVAAPVISPNGGLSAEAVRVTLSTSTVEAAIHYTTDGRAPTLASTLYSEPFLLSHSATVRVKAFKAGLGDSDETIAEFMIGAGKPPVEIVIDDNDPQVVYVGEDWEEVGHLNNSHGGRAHWHYNNEGGTVTWRFSLQTSGVYEVFAWWGEGYGGLGTKVPYIIKHAEDSATVFVDQNIDAEQWHSLGQYSFAAGDSSYVRMTDATGDSDKFVVADAIKLVPVQREGEEENTAPALE